MGRQPAPDGKNLVHPLLVVPSSAESTLETTEKRTTMTGASVGALCATALGAAAIWKLKSALWLAGELNVELWLAVDQLVDELTGPRDL